MVALKYWLNDKGEVQHAMGTEDGAIFTHPLPNTNIISEPKSYEFIEGDKKGDVREVNIKHYGPPIAKALVFMYHPSVDCDVDVEAYSTVAIDDNIYYGKLLTKSVTSDGHDNKGTTFIVEGAFIHLVDYHQEDIHRALLFRITLKKDVPKGKAFTGFIQVNGYE